MSWLERKAQSDVYDANFETKLARNEAAEEAALANKAIHTVVKIKAQRDFLQQELEKAAAIINGLEETVADYESMLTMPMMELAKKTGKFAETYLAQKKSRAEWMVSQRGWKKLAIAKMKREGMSDDDINEAFKESEKEAIMEMSEQTDSVKIFKDELLADNSK